MDLATCCAFRLNYKEDFDFIISLGQVDMYLLDWLVNNVNPFFMHPYLPTLACMYESGVEQYLGMPSGGSVPSFNFIFVLVAVGVTAFSHLVLS